MVDTPLLCISDDLTGAVACGAELRRRGLTVSVASWEAPISDEVDAHVADTASRLLPATEAARRVASLVDDRGARSVYKRIDSRLRGNVAAELEALTGTLGRAALIAAAAPAYGITTDSGIQRRGSDPVQTDDLEGPSSARLAEILGKDAREVAARPGVAELEQSLGGARYVVCDASSLADLAALADSAKQARTPFVPVGSYGLASALTVHAATPRILVAVGSRDPVTERQLELATHDTNAVVLRGDSSSVATQALRAIREERPDGMIIIGGETASAVVQFCGVESMEIIAEPWPATPIVRFVGGSLDGVRGIVKSGGRGDDTWLLYAIGMLS